MKNPFATNYVAPGVLDWFGDSEASLDAIANRCKVNQYRGIILGPHGSGKSTLLEHLVPMLGSVKVRTELGVADPIPHQWTEKEPPVRNADKEILWFRLRGRSVAADLIRQIDKLGEQGDVVVIDGWEQLSALSRWRLYWQTKWQGMGLLVTAHHRGFWGLPVIHETRVTVQLAMRLLRQIAPEFTEQFSAADLQRQLAQQLDGQQGNFREVLMDLYDQFQAASCQALAE